MNKVFVTGGTGFLGSHLLEALSEKDVQVVAIYRTKEKLEALKKDCPKVAKAKNINWICGDLFSETWSLEGFDVIYHLAGYIGYKESDRIQMNKINVRGTEVVLNKIKKEAPSAKLIYLSSVVAVGASFERSQILDETSKFNLSSYNLGYFETKKEAEELVMDFAGQGFFAVCLNPSTIYGARDMLKSSRKGQLAAARGRLKFYPEGGVSVVSVRDVCDALLEAPKKAKSGERYILAGDNISIYELLSEISNQCAKSKPFIKLPKGLLLTVGHFGTFLLKFGINIGVSFEKLRVVTLYHWFKSDKAKRELGFNSKSYKDSISESLDWARENKLI